MSSLKGRKQSKELIAKRSEAIQSYWDTHKNSEEVLERNYKISESNKNKHPSEEVRRNMSISHTGKPHPHTEEHNRRIAESNKGKKMSEEARKNMSVAKLKLYVDKPEIKTNMSEIHKLRFQNNPNLNEVMRLRRNKLIMPFKDTSIEVKIQSQLRELGYDFFTHQYMSEITHAYRCDVFVPSLNLVIECDGNYWHKYPVGNNIDHIRTSELISKGFKVLRLWELDIRKMSLDDLKNKILKMK